MSITLPHYRRQAFSIQSFLWKLTLYIRKAKIPIQSRDHCNKKEEKRELSKNILWDIPLRCQVPIALAYPHFPPWSCCMLKVSLLHYPTALPGKSPHSCLSKYDNHHREGHSTEFVLKGVSPRIADQPLIFKWTLIPLNIAEKPNLVPDHFSFLALKEEVREALFFSSTGTTCRIHIHAQLTHSLLCKQP